MSNSTKTAKNQRTSKFLGNRRKRFLNRKEALVLPDLPNAKAEDKKADIFCKYFREGFYRVKFICRKTKRSAFGYAPTITQAFENMERNFNQKYL